MRCHVHAVQVDLRGFLGERSWLRPILDALGWVDAYVERMLMAVILVKDEVGARLLKSGRSPCISATALAVTTDFTFATHKKPMITGSRYVSSAHADKLCTLTCAASRPCLQVEQQRFLVQPFSILTNNHAARASSTMVTATSAAGSSAAEADESQEAATLREGYSQHLRQQQLMRQRRRQLALQQQQQQAAYMQRNAMQAGYTADEAARLAAQGYWGSGVTTSQAGMLRPGGGMHVPQGMPFGLFAPDYGMQWPYKGPLMGTGTDGGYSRQQHEMVLQGAEGAPQLKRSSTQGRQQGRLGRMASRIYSLRPRLRKGDSGGERASASAAAAGAAGNGVPGSAGLYSQLSASFKDNLSAQNAADLAAAADAAAPAGAAAAASSVDAAAGVSPLAEAAGAEAAGSSAQTLDLSDTPAVLKRLGMAPDTPVVGPQYYIGGPTGPAAKYSSLNHRYAVSLPCGMC